MTLAPRNASCGLVACASFLRLRYWRPINAGEEVAMFSWLNSPKLLARAEIAAKQMRYFRLFSQKGLFEGQPASARRAGFEIKYEDAFGKVARFHWAADRDSDFTFFVSFSDPPVVHRECGFTRDNIVEACLGLRSTNLAGTRISFGAQF